MRVSDGGTDAAAGVTNAAARDLLDAEPGTIVTCAGQLREVAYLASTAAVGLEEAAEAKGWHGQAADAFRKHLGQLPKKFGTVDSVYDEVAATLSSYAGQVSELQDEFNGFIRQYQATQQAYNDAATTLGLAAVSNGNPVLDPSSAPDPLNPASGVITPGPGGMNLGIGTSGQLLNPTPAQQAASQQLGPLSDQLHKLFGQGNGILNEFTALRGRVGGQIDAQTQRAPGPDVIGYFKAAALSVADLLDGKDFYEIATNPSLKTFSHTLMGVGITASIGLMLVAPEASPEIAEADGAAETAVESASVSTKVLAGMKAVTGIDNGVNKGITGLKIASTVAGAGQAGIDFGEGNTEAGFIDAAFLLGPTLGTVPTSLSGIRTPGEIAAERLSVNPTHEFVTTNTELAQVQNFQSLRNAGKSVGEASTRAFGSDGAPKLLNGVDLSNPSAVATVIQQTNSELQKLGTTAILAGPAVSVPVDQGAAAFQSAAVQQATPPPNPGPPPAPAKR